MQTAQQGDLGRSTVLELLKELILDSGLAPGDRLPTELALATQLNASRNAVREALRALEGQGTVEIRHGHGIYLRHAPFSGLTDILTLWGRIFERDGLEGLRPIAEVREVLETNLLCRVVPLLSSSDLRTLSQAVRTMEDRAESGERAADADRHFHETLYRPLDNWVTTYLVSAFWEAFGNVERETQVPRRPPDVIAQQHRDILEALKRRDAGAAADAMRVHFDNALHPSPSAGQARDTQPGHAP